MKRWLRRDQRAQLHVVEAIIVGILVFTILFVTSVFRIPTSPGTFQQAELSGLARDTLVALLAKPPGLGADCNEPLGTECPFDSELERMLSLSQGYQGASFDAADEPSTVELVEYLAQALPPGTGYILSFSNGVNTTVVYPLDIVAPALDVSVGHLFVTFKWDEYATQAEDSMIIRLGEKTGFLSGGSGAVSAIRDPLNRTEDAEGVAHLTSFRDALGLATVPDHSVYGTYRLEYGIGPLTANFTVVPPGIFGAGSSILPEDRDPSTGITSVGSLDGLPSTLLHYSGTPGFDAGDAMYLDLAGGNTVSIGDLRLSPVGNALDPCRGASDITCPAGSHVEAGDGDLGDSLQDALGPVRPAKTGVGTVLEEGDGIYYDADLSGAVSAGDRRFTRVGPYAFGSAVVAGDADHGTDLADLVGDDFTARNILWADLDGDTAFDPGEPVYLDLVGHGQGPGLEPYDVHLSPRGSPTARYLYDVRMVVWYGI